jgi:hypothetical protein
VFIYSFLAATQPVHACQEMFALGSANFLGSFVGSMPVVASLGRSAVNGASGARTTFGGIVTGLIILMACAFLTPHFAYIPTCALAAVIISAMIFTIDIDILESQQFMPEIMQQALIGTSYNYYCKCRIMECCKVFISIVLYLSRIYCGPTGYACRFFLLSAHAMISGVNWWLSQRSFPCGSHRSWTLSPTPSPLFSASLSASRLDSLLAPSPTSASSCTRQAGQTCLSKRGRLTM